MKEAREAYDKCLDFDPRNVTYLSHAGHFYGEYLLDIEKSFELLEKAYQIRPKDSTTMLNYAEGLITIGKAQEGYNIATKYLQEGNEIDNALNANFIRVYALCFLGKVSEGWRQLKNLVMFFRSCPPSLEKTNIWTYNKIRKYINESKLKKKEKKFYRIQLIY
jgi:tetratricopeptide (TPR) repeat protein